MDDELRQLEAELKRLQPAAPSRALSARIARELDAPEAPRVQRESTGRLVWLWAAALPIAASIALTLAVSHRPGGGGTPGRATPSVLAAEGFKPVAAENVLYSATDEGLVTLEDGTPARRERLQFVDTITWKNPRTNASLRWSVPREEVRVVPVVFQ